MDLYEIGTRDPDESVMAWSNDESGPVALRLSDHSGRHIVVGLDRGQVQQLIDALDKAAGNR